LPFLFNSSYLCRISHVCQSRWHLASAADHFWRGHRLNLGQINSSCRRCDRHVKEYKSSCAIISHFIYIPEEWNVRSPAKEPLVFWIIRRKGKIAAASPDPIDLQPQHSHGEYGFLILPRKCGRQTGRRTLSSWRGWKIWGRSLISAAGPGTGGLLLKRTEWKSAGKLTVFR
jgi:hypothetical protein